MLIWRDNKIIPKFLKSSILERIEENHIDKEKFYTSFIDGEGEKFSDLLVPYYESLVEKLVKDLGIFRRSRYIYNIWVQMYNSETDTHGPHSHFGGNEIISFTHIIQSSEQKCFYFLGEDDKKIYPDQKSGDILAWPSWVMHGVDNVKEYNIDRLVVSGNVALTSYYGGNLDTSVVCTKDETGQIIWSMV